MSSDAASGTPTSRASVTPVKQNRKHRRSEDSIATRQDLGKAKKEVVKALKKVQAQQRAEAKATARMVAKAPRLTIEQVVAIVDMKTEIPDIVCRHCSCGLKTGKELRQALRDTIAGVRERYVNASGKALKTDP